VTWDVDGFAVEFHTDGRGVLVRVAGEVDAATAPALSAQLERAVEWNSGDVMVDLAGVTFFDSTAVRALLRARTGLTARGRRLVVSDPAPNARRVLELTGLAGAFELDRLVGPD
jgi:anti-sigma B factor antagonist